MAIRAGLQGGMGVYALVASALSGAAADAAFLFWRAAWKAKLHFDWQQLPGILPAGQTPAVFQEIPAGSWY